MENHNPLKTTISNQAKLPRRMALKLAAGGGLLAGSALLTEQWSKPVLKAVMLPAHAQTSVVMNTFSGSTDLEIVQAAPINEKSILDLFVEPALAGNVFDLVGISIEAYAVQTGDDVYDFQFLITSRDTCKSKEVPVNEIFAFVEFSATGGMASVPTQSICDKATGVNGSISYEIDGDNLALSTVSFASEAFDLGPLAFTLEPGGVALQDPGSCTLCPVFE